MKMVVKDAFVFREQGTTVGLNQWTESMKAHLRSIFTTVDLRLRQPTDDMQVLMEFLLMLATQVCRSRPSLVTDTPTWALCTPPLRQLLQTTQPSRPLDVCMIAHNTFSYAALKNTIREKKSSTETIGFHSMVGRVDPHCRTKQVFHSCQLKSLLYFQMVQTSIFGKECGTSLIFS